MKKILNIKIIFYYQEIRKCFFFILKNGRELMRNENRKNEFVSNFLKKMEENLWEMKVERMNLNLIFYTFFFI